jgi:hypothetical protein
MVVFSEVIDQVSKEEVPFLNEQEMVKCHMRCYDKMEDRAPPDDACTPAQLAALHTLIERGSAPDAAFDVFGPRGLRLLKRIVLSGYIQQGGTIRHVEMRGPATYGQWVKRFRVLKVGLISLGAVSPAAIDAYMRLIDDFVERYGIVVWAIIYQADVRMRLERMTDIKVEGQIEHS